MSGFLDLLGLMDFILKMVIDSKNRTHSFLGDKIHRDCLER
jgi:hypothetical protein